MGRELAEQVERSVGSLTMGLWTAEGSRKRVDDGGVGRRGTARWGWLRASILGGNGLGQLYKQDGEVRRAGETPPEMN